MDVHTITEEEAIHFLQNLQNKNVIRTFSENPDIKVMNGRYGAYITNGTDNYRIPKEMLAENLTYQDCVNIMANNTPTSKKRIIRKKA